MKKIEELNKGLNNLSSKNSDTINKLSNELNLEKNKSKDLEDKMNDILKQNKLDKENLEKELNSRKNDYNIKNDEFANIQKKYEDQIKAKEEQILILKLNNEKIMSLNDQKLNFQLIVI